MQKGKWWADDDVFNQLNWNEVKEESDLNVLRGAVIDHVEFMRPCENKDNRMVGAGVLIYFRDRHDVCRVIDISGPEDFPGLWREVVCDIADWK